MTKSTPQPSTLTAGNAIDTWPAKPMEAMKTEWPRMRCRFINAHPTGAWTDFILSEWELERCGWEDFHPHTETCFVIEGELHIECDGETITLGPGDSARVNPGRAGRYTAPVYARMLATYGPNPHGKESHSFRYFEI
jgi:uncharacterized cupin superfamily protein